MAKLTAHGGLRLLLHGDRLQFAFDSSDPVHGRLGRLRFAEKSGENVIRSSRCGKLPSFRKKRVAGSSSGADQQLDGFNHGAGFEEEVEDFETDDLAPFRGLVLDISYRPVNVVCWKRAICLEFFWRPYHFPTLYASGTEGKRKKQAGTKRTGVGEGDGSARARGGHSGNVGEEDGAERRSLLVSRSASVWILPTEIHDSTLLSLPCFFLAVVDEGQLYRWEECNGVPLKLILRVEPKLSRMLKLRRSDRDAKEGWAECSD